MPASKTPQNILAEEALLGSVLIDPEVLARINGLKPEHFYLLKNRLIFEAILGLHDKNSPLDFVTLTAELDARGILAQIGGATYLLQLISATPSAINAAQYANLIVEAWRKRSLLELLTETAKLTARDDDLSSATEYIKHQIQALLPQESGGERSFQSFKEIESALNPISWLWQGWIPRGMITLLGAAPGAGKSMIALDIAKRIIHAECFPDGSKSNTTTRKVIYVDAEVVPQIIKERCVAWHINTENLYIMLPQAHGMIDFGNDEYRDYLYKMVQSIKPDLIVIDSLGSISVRGENNIEDIRGILAFLNQIAVESDTALLLIHHLRKRGTQFQPQDVSIDDFRGSSHIIAMSRSVLALSIVQTTQIQEQNGPRKLQCVKSNVGAYPRALGVEFMPLEPSGVYLKWNSEAPRPYREPSKTDLCAEWLRGELLDGPLSISELAARGADAGYSRATIFRARAVLGALIRDTDGRQSPSNKWSL